MENQNESLQLVINAVAGDAVEKERRRIGERFISHRPEVLIHGSRPFRHGQVVFHSEVRCNCGYMGSVPGLVESDYESRVLACAHLLDVPPDQVRPRE